MEAMIGGTITTEATSIGTGGLTIRIALVLIINIALLKEYVCASLASLKAQMEVA